MFITQPKEMLILAYFSFGSCLSITHFISSLQNERYLNTFTFYASFRANLQLQTR